MRDVATLAIAVLVPLAALVLISRQFFAYKSHKADAATAHAEAYRELAERLDRSNRALADELSQLRNRLQSVEDLLRTID
jgi:hypothetical protein